MGTPMALRYVVVIVWDIGGSLFGLVFVGFFFFQAEDGIRDAQESRGLGDVYKRQHVDRGDDGHEQDCLARHRARPSRLRRHPDLAALRLSLIHI